jgi:hypothetical protein
MSKICNVIGVGSGDGGSETSDDEGPTGGGDDGSETSDD